MVAADSVTDTTPTCPVPSISTSSVPGPFPGRQRGMTPERVSRPGGVSRWRLGTGHPEGRCPNLVRPPEARGSEIRMGGRRRRDRLDAWYRGFQDRCRLRRAQRTPRQHERAGEPDAGDERLQRRILQRADPSCPSQYRGQATVMHRGPVSLPYASARRTGAEMESAMAPSKRKARPVPREYIAAGPFHRRRRNALGGEGLPGSSFYWLWPYGPSNGYRRLMVIAPASRSRRSMRAVRTACSGATPSGTSREPQR